MLQIINIIETVNGIIRTIKSFIITDETETVVLKQAEDLFIKLAKENGCKENDADILINNIWQHDNYEVAMILSNDIIQ